MNAFTTTTFAALMWMGAYGQTFYQLQLVPAEFFVVSERLQNPGLWPDDWQPFEIGILATATQLATV